MSEPLRQYYLQQLGIETWLLRAAPDHQSITLMVIVDEIPDTNQKSNNLLKKMLLSLGLPDEDIHLISVQQFMAGIAIEPQLILAVGYLVGQLLLNTTVPLSHLIQKTHDYQGIPLFVSIHPSDLLAHPADKKKAYQNLMLLKGRLGR